MLNSTVCVCVRVGLSGIWRQGSIRRPNRDVLFKSLAFLRWDERKNRGRERVRGEGRRGETESVSHRLGRLLGRSGAKNGARRLQQRVAFLNGKNVAVAAAAAAASSPPTSWHQCLIWSYSDRANQSWLWWEGGGATAGVWVLLDWKTAIQQQCGSCESVSLNTAGQLFFSRRRVCL